MFLHLCDSPGVSTTRVCADDFGSDLRSLSALKRQAAIFRIARSACGVHLKPEKCVLIFVGVKITEEFVVLVRAWLRDNVPEFQNFRIRSAGKYLGWHLGVKGTAISFKDPVDKFGKRVVEVSCGKAPPSLSLLRYNERAVSVLSYVSMFSAPPQELNLALKEQHALHKILRFAPNSMTRDLLHSIELFTVVAPTHLLDYCDANLFRFAYSEKVVFG